jgi:hypothetical protein
MAEKDKFERVVGIEIFLYLLPVIGLFLLWKDKNKLSGLYLLMGTVVGILNLLLMINEAIKYELI